MTITRALSATAFLAKAATGTGSANTGSAANTSTFNFNPHLRGASYTNSHSSDNLRTLPNITEPPVKLWEVNSAHGRRLSQETCAAELTDLLISLQEKTADSAALEYTNCVNSKYNLEQNQAESVYSLLLNQFKTAGVMETIDDYRALLSNPEFVMKMADAEQGQYFDDLVKSFTTTSITTTTTGTNSSTTVSVSTTGTTNDQCVFNFNCGGVLTPAQLAKVQDTCQKLVYQNLSNDELNKQACAAVATITETTTTVTVTQQDATTPISQTKDASLATLSKEDAALSNTLLTVGGTVLGVLLLGAVAVALYRSGYRCSRRRSPAASEISKEVTPEKASAKASESAARSKARAAGAAGEPTAASSEARAVLQSVVPT
jgi:hypothetical protein